MMRVAARNNTKMPSQTFQSSRGKSDKKTIEIEMSK
jgi:hypothetical protein